LKIGEYDNGTPLAVKIDTLVETRLLIQASSGGGKSNAIRLIAEAAAGHVQTIIIDREGELHTLAAKADMLVVGEEGAIAPNPRNAGALAIELLRSGVSCVVDLLGIAPAQQKTYVRAFVENMNAAPRELWHPVLVVIDEAHVFCPEKGHGEAECSEAIEILMSAGRKRGYCGILATQRVSILSKTAAAEATNKLIGRANLDLDYKRAGDEMGMPRKDAPLLARLKTGQFHVLGPAFGATSEYRLAQLQKAETKPPPRGSRGAVAAPSKSILAKLPALEAIGKETNPDDVHTIEKARERIKALKAELAAERRKPAPAAPPPAPVDVAAIERRAKIDATNGLASIIAGLANKIRDDGIDVAAKFKEHEAFLRGVVRHTLESVKNTYVEPSAPTRPTRPPSVPAVRGEGGQVTRTQQRVLDAAAFLHAIGHAEPKVLAVGLLAGIDPTGGHFSNTVGPLSTGGLIIRGGGTLSLTDSGRAAANTPEWSSLADYHAALRECVDRKSGAAARIFDYLVETGNHPTTSEAIGTAVGIDHTGGHFSNSIGPLGTLGLIRRRAGTVEPTDILFPEGLA